MDVTLISGCLSGDYHWFSIRILDLYLDGVINTGDFLRWFHMPNSDYIETAQCVVSLYVPAYVPGTNQAAVLGYFLGYH